MTAKRLKIVATGVSPWQNENTQKAVNTATELYPITRGFLAWFSSKIAESGNTFKPICNGEGLMLS